jgi:hypothetical protein
MLRFNVFEILRSFHTYRALALVKDLGKRLIESSGEPRSCAYLIQRISIAIQRGNAASILATVPTSSKFQEIFYL